MTGDIVSFLVLAQRPDCAVLWSEEDHGLNAATEISMPTAPSAWPRIDRRQPSPRGGRGGFDGALRHIAECNRRFGVSTSGRSSAVFCPRGAGLVYKPTW